MDLIITPIGVFSKDQKGQWHYRAQNAHTVWGSIKDALKYLPTSESCLFWFNGTPAPIDRSSTESTVYRNWYEWRTDIKSYPACLPQKLQSLAL